MSAGAAATLGLAGAGTASGATEAPPAVDPENVHIYLLFGQSNMEGQGTVEPEDEQTREDVRVLQDKTCPDLNRAYGTWYLAEPPLNRCWAGIGPGDYFGKKMAKETPDDVVIGLVPAAVSGCDIALFEKGAPIGTGEYSVPRDFPGGYQWLLDLAQQAQKVGTIKGILLHQGETNTGDPEWKYAVEGIYEDLRADLDIGKVPFLAGEMLYADQGGACAAHNEEVAKIPDVIDNGHVVSAEGLGGQDQYHFDAAGYRELGKRYADVMLDALDVSPTPETSRPLDATDPDGDGLYEDINGNRQLDFPDVNLLFQNTDDTNDAKFDFDGDGDVDMQDVLALFEMV
ncbi:sialate O-acetylesterase [Halococcoides cellulosivorans]|uniref:sialate O-acetylesterase n=1 Tax=Halococcoides cellulosivorans TaxID=1679096 RepID=UPI00131F183F|nr:sialate O-acetylesterase [Halococcoides cellulosivorans]